MATLLVFAFISGLITILAPCIWPLLPIILSASTTGGHRKPLGITLGVILSFGILTLSISYIIRIIPFNPDILRFFAVIIIGFLGFVLLIPALSAKLEGWVSNLSGRLNIGNQTKTGFIGGLITGIALGIVWAPCAGPILATIATLSATQKVNGSIILITIIYCIGIAIPLFLFALLGRKLFVESKRLSPYLGRIQQVFGLIMIVTAILILTNYDKTLETKLLNFFPSYGNFQSKFEGNTAVTNELNQIKNIKGQSIDKNSLLNTNTPAPEITGITNWINSQPLTIKDLKGKVVLVDFWTYTCINCIRTLPHVTGWYEKYKDQGFVVIGVHTPEFQFEHENSNVEQAVKQYGIHYPVAQDNNYATWNAYLNQYWPAEYLIDTNGNVRRVNFGEGDYDSTEEAIKLLLKDAGRKVDNKLLNAGDQTPQGKLSPETYLGSARMAYYSPNGSVSNGTSNFTADNNLPINTFDFGGKWNVADENATALGNSKINYNFFADKVFLVMAPGTKPGQVKVYLDGKLIDDQNAGTDVKDGMITIDEDRLYNLVDLKDGPANHNLRIEFSNGVKAFAFTFG